MTLAELARSIPKRFRRPATWGLILGFGAAWIAARLLVGVTFQRIGTWEWFLPAVFMAGHVALSALPWQWTGDDRAMVPMWRGILQAIPWNAAWVLLLLWGVNDVVRPPRPEPPRRPQDVQGPKDPDPKEGRPPRPEEESRRPGEDSLPPREDRPRRPRRAENTPNPPPPGPRQEWMLLMLNVPFGMVLGLFLSEKERVERLEGELMKRERQARARALQAQLHPHVLFNVLGGITELVHEDPDAAEEALVGLTELLRMLMRHGSAVSLPLAQEHALLRRYLEIEGIRLGPRLEVQWNWQEDLERIQVPPLLLQPLVENAVKHGISASPEGGKLRIAAIRTGTGLLLRVSNTGLPLGKTLSEGTGLGNLRERLALLAEPKPVLDLRQEGEWTVAELRFEGTLGP